MHIDAIFGAIGRFAVRLRWLVVLVWFAGAVAAAALLPSLLGTFERGKLAKQIEDKTFALKAGEVTDVIQTKQGYVILKVVDHQQAGIPPLKDILPKIQDALYYQKLQPALRAYLTKLREEAYIKYAPGFVDSGASPNQTQPIETAAAKEADAKKLGKKKHKKLGIL